MSDTPNYFIAILIAGSPLGWIGTHHYYLGNKYRAAFYLIFLLTLIPPLLSLLDAFILIYRGQETFIEKYGDDEDMEAYHLRELRKHNPILAQQIAAKREEHDLEDIDKEDIPDSATEFIKQKEKEVYGEEEEESDEEEKRRRRGEPDYSDYYGNWN